MNYPQILSIISGMP